MRDPELFPSPDKFDPTRYLDPDTSLAQRAAMDPRNAIFGFGRRLCPGMHLADASLWLVLTRMAATLDIRAALCDGEVGQLNVRYSNPVFRSPDVFPCRIVPRSAEAAALLALDENEV